MNKRLKLFIGIGITFLLLVFTFVTTNMVSNNKNAKAVIPPKESAVAASDGRTVVLNYSKCIVTDDILRKNTDIAIEGTVEKLDEKSIKDIVDDSATGEKLKLTLPVSIYSVRVNDTIYNKKNNVPDKIRITITDPNIRLEVGKTYSILLYKVIGKSCISGTYGLVSIDQGLYEISEDKQEITSVSTGEKLIYADFKSKFQN